MNTYLDSMNTAECCGCSACLDACPVQAITMVYKNDKAKYPQIDESKCIKCGKCRKVCPMKVSNKNLEERHAYVALLQDENLREQSASGGAFVGIVNALQSTEDELWVAGAAWYEAENVKHVLRKANDIDEFKKSKYVQSDCYDIYSEVETKLKEGKSVLFVGTPCQVVAVKNFLGKQYPKLFTVDIICHGVAGSAILQKYLNEIKQKYKSEIERVDFRYKKKDLYGEIHSDNMRIRLENGKEICENKKTSSYLRGFHCGLFYRDSCYCCKFANLDRNSDLTIGDYWHIQKLKKDMIDYTGVSCILVNSKKGQAIVSNITDMYLEETEIDFLVSHNGQLANPSKKPETREQFLNSLDQVEFKDLIIEYVGEVNYPKYILSKCLPGKIKRLFK